MPRWMERLREIHSGVERHRARLAADYTWLREQCGGDPQRFAREWRELVAQRPFDDVNDLVRDHNEWYPVERQLPMDPRTGERADRRPALHARGADRRVGAGAVPAWSFEAGDGPSSATAAHASAARGARRRKTRASVAASSALSWAKKRSRTAWACAASASATIATPAAVRCASTARESVAHRRRCTSSRRSSASMWRETRERLSPACARGSTAAATSRRRRPSGSATPAC